METNKSDISKYSELRKLFVAVLFPGIVIFLVLMINLWNRKSEPIFGIKVGMSCEELKVLYAKKGISMLTDSMIDEMTNEAFGSGKKPEYVWSYPSFPAKDELYGLLKTYPVDYICQDGKLAMTMTAFNYEDYPIILSILTDKLGIGDSREDKSTVWENSKSFIQLIQPKYKWGNSDAVFWGLDVPDFRNKEHKEYFAFLVIIHRKLAKKAYDNQRKQE